MQTPVPRILTRRLQFWLIPSIAGIICITVGSSKLPFTHGYRFPWQLFIILILFIFITWEVNLQVYRWLDKRLPFYENPANRLTRQVLGCFAATIITFTVLYGVVQLVFNDPFRWKGYLLYLFIALAVSALINSIYIIRYLQQVIFYKDEIRTRELNTALQQIQKKNITSQQPVLTEQLIVKTGNREIPVSFNEMSYWYSADGIVVLFKTNGQKITTNYTSFNAIITALPFNLFFQLNRQYIVHLQSIRSVTDDTNRKLLIQLQPATDQPVSVSRYRSAEFKKWFRTGIAG